MPMRVSLVGYRACGKTTIGRLAAARLGWPYCDLDAVIEAGIGGSIADFFARNPESAFRDREAEALAAVLARPAPLLLATGGGCVLRSANRDLLRANSALVVYLQAPATVLRERLRLHAGGRPSLTGAAVADEVAAVLAVREPLYRAVSDVVVDANRPPETVADDVARLVENLSGTGQNRR